jgi:hypothetical protein
MFDTTKEDLKDILRWSHEGRLQLPDFQRDYVWADEDARSLIASVAKGFPIGALLTLDTGGEVEFKPRPISGIPAKDVHPEQLLLDGQQRVTSLYQSTFSANPVRTRNPKGAGIARYYYLDIEKAVSAGANIQEAIVGIPADRIVRTNFGKTIDLDLSTREKEYAHRMFPLNRVFDSKDWFYGWRDYWKEKGEDVYQIEKAFDLQVIDRIARYKMPIIRLDKENSREAVCLVFEKVNVGGIKLDAFELVTAIYASSSFDLREDWKGSEDATVGGRRTRILGNPVRQDALRELAPTDFLQACTLLHTRELRLQKAAEGVVGKELPQVSCRRDAVLGLPLAAYRGYADAVESGFIEAGRFLNEQKIIWHRDVPYPPQSVALAATFAILKKQASSAAAKEKLSQWFWCAVLGELYGSTTEGQLARDVPELVDWLTDSGAPPRSMDEALFQIDRLRTLRSRLSAAYKGVHALLMRRGCRDFITGRSADLMTFFNDRIDIHHIFPEAWCKTRKIPRAVYNSIVNKTALSRASNIAIGGSAPSVYLKRIQEKHGLTTAQLDDILRTHLIDPEPLRGDDFDGFFSARMTALSGLIADAMGKAVAQEKGTNEAEIDTLDNDEDIDVDEAVPEAA